VFLIFFVYLAVIKGMFCGATLVQRVAVGATDGQAQKNGADYSAPNYCF